MPFPPDPKDAGWYHDPDYDSLGRLLPTQDELDDEAEYGPRDEYNPETNPSGSDC